MEVAEPAAEKKDSKEFLPWVEKYRPMVLEDIVGNAEAVERMTVIAAQGNIPNLIFSVRGAPGAPLTPALLPGALSRAAPRGRARVRAGASRLRQDDQHPLPCTRAAGCAGACLLLRLQGCTCDCGLVFNV